MNDNFKFGALWRYQDEIVQGLVLTLQLSVVTMVCGLAIGLGVAMAAGRPARASCHAVSR